MWAVASPRAFTALGKPWQACWSCNWSELRPQEILEARAEARVVCGTSLDLAALGGGCARVGVRRVQRSEHWSHLGGLDESCHWSRRRRDPRVSCPTAQRCGWRGCGEYWGWASGVLGWLGHMDSAAACVVKGGRGSTTHGALTWHWGVPAAPLLCGTCSRGSKWVYYWYRSALNQSSWCPRMGKSVQCGPFSAPSLLHVGALGVGCLSLHFWGPSYLLCRSCC